MMSPSFSQDVRFIELVAERNELVERLNAAELALKRAEAERAFLWTSDEIVAAVSELLSPASVEKFLDALTDTMRSARSEVLEDPDKLREDVNDD